jgi:hypothetical protein
MEPIVSAICSQDKKVLSFAKYVFGSMRVSTTPGILGIGCTSGLLNHHVNKLIVSLSFPASVPATCILAISISLHSFPLRGRFRMDKTYLSVAAKMNAVTKVLQDCFGCFALSLAFQKLSSPPGLAHCIQNTHRLLETREEGRNRHSSIHYLTSVLAAEVVLEQKRTLKPLRRHHLSNRAQPEPCLETVSRFHTDAC